MDQSGYCEIIKEQTKRALWEVENVISCIPDELWMKEYCQMPLSKHVYHMLHSLDRWMINPRGLEYQEPYFHEPELNNLDVFSDKQITREEINHYMQAVKDKITTYLNNLKEEELLQKPENCEYTRFTLIMAQHRHLHSHMGMIMGFLIDDLGKWPRVLGLEKPFPTGEYNKFF